MSKKGITILLAAVFLLAAVLLLLLPRWSAPAPSESSGTDAEQSESASPVSDASLPAEPSPPPLALLAEGLQISEVMPANRSYPNNVRGKLFDWVELRNDSDSELNLNEYYLSDDADELHKNRLPDRTLSPGECFLVYCSGDSSLSAHGYCHVDFKLHVGERVYLSREDSGISDSAPLPLLPGNGSYGRLEDRAGFFYLEQRSPGKVNSEGYRHISAKPEAGVPQGIYEDVDGLEVTLSGPGEIRYTLDGSLPTRGSSLYQGPISVKKTTVIRAISFEEGRLPSPCCTLSYIVNEGHTLPVVSLACDPKDFDRMVEQHYDNTIEIPADAAFFEGAGEDALFQKGCDLTLQGASSRHFYKKSYKMRFKDRFGGDLKCDVFGLGEEQDYYSLQLRGGTVDHMYIVKDSLASLVALQVCDEPLTLNVRYCIAYINGEYYGIYALREAYSSRYAEVHTGSPKGQAQVQKNRGPDVMAEIYEYCRQHSLAKDDAYEAFCQTFDVDAFARWLALEAYFNNTDPDGNIRYVRGEGTDWKWTAALFDLDLCLWTKEASYDYFFSEFSEISYITSRLMQNKQFKEVMLRNASELYHRGLGAELSRDILKDITDQLDPEMERNCLRWSEGPEIWEKGKNNMYKRLGPERTLTWIQSLQRYMHVSDAEIANWFGDLSELKEAAG